MVKRFSDRSRKVLAACNQEMTRRGWPHIGTEVILQAILKEPGGIALDAFDNLGISSEQVTRQIDDVIGTENTRPAKELPLKPTGKIAINRALAEADRLGDNILEPGHLLLGLIDDPDGITRAFIGELNVSPDRFRDEVVRLLERAKGH